MDKIITIAGLESFCFWIPACVGMMNLETHHNGKNHSARNDCPPERIA